jgi:hypothetical protein
MTLAPCFACLIHVTYSGRTSLEVQIHVHLHDHWLTVTSVHRIILAMHVLDYLYDVPMNKSLFI